MKPKVQGKSTDSQCGKLKNSQSYLTGTEEIKDRCKERNED